MSNECQIIVVDDDHEDHFILREYFSDAGKDHCVRFIENGKKALEFLEQLPDHDLPRLIVLDLNMPILNGTQTLLKLKETSRLKNIPVIVFSTSENENEKRKCLSFGAVDYIVKPIGFDDGKVMVDKFMQYLRES